MSSILSQAHTGWTSATSKEGHASLRPVKLGVIGMNFGAGIARNLANGNPYIELTAVCDLDRAKTDHLSREIGVAGYYELDQLLDDPSIEAVGLFTAGAGRASLIQKILRTGRHVMTTKPFELELAAAEAVLHEAAERRLAVHLNSPAPIPAEDVAQILAWVTEHELGRPVSMRAETWANYRETANGSWYDNPLLCPAAPIFRLGIYFLNDFAPLMGKPVNVYVMASRVRTGRPTADNAQLAIEFENGAFANVFASFCVNDGKPWPDRVTLNYENGTIRRWMDRTGGVEMSADAAVVTLDHPTARVASVSTRPGAFAGWYQWNSFHDAIRGDGAVPLQNSEGILYGVRLLDAMRRSALSGSPEAVRT